MKVLIACEYSGAVRDEFTKLGFDAISCDLLPTESPGKHYQGNLFDIINDGFELMVAFPPCTHLAVSGAAWFEQKRKDGRQQQGIDFFMKVAKANIKHIAIENPVGIMSSHYRKPDQIIQPYYFGDQAQKTTCLWLKNLPMLKHYARNDLFNEKTHVSKGEFYEFESNNGIKKRMPLWYFEALNNKNTSKTRSKTFPGIAKAMAEQWGEFLINKYNLKLKQNQL